jgi:O-antigen/teichoic acid export membrane protein
VSNKVSNIAKNTSYFTLALILQKVLTLAYFAVLARNINPEDLGKFYVSLSFASIFLTIIDLGQANVLTREVAKDDIAAKKYIRSIMAIKFPLIILSSAMVAAMANVLNYPDITKNLIYLSVGIMILDSLSTTFFAIIRGYHNLSYESVISVLMQAVILILGLFFIHEHLGLYFLMVATISGSIFRFSTSLILLTKKWKVSLRPDFNWPAMKAILAITAPFAMFAIFNKLYLYLDTVMLSKLAGDYETGIYQIAFKFIFALQFLPLAFVASLYPAFAKYWGEGNESTQLAVTFERAINYLTFIALPISAGIFAIAPELIRFFKPEYAAGVGPLRITILALFFIFLNYPIGSLLNACDRQKDNTRNMLIALALSVVLNIFLIPKFQAWGAGITVLATNITMFALSLGYVPKIMKLRPQKMLMPFLKAAISTALMFMFVINLKGSYNVFIVSGIGGMIYFVALFLSRAVRREDVVSIWGSFARK